MEEKFSAAKASFPEASAALGENIFKALNCAGCHRHSSIQPRAVAPPLAQEGRRVNRAWLENYLRHPVALRPFGYRPGEGSRMPDFNLSAEEASVVSAFLCRDEGKLIQPRTFQPRVLSAFSMHKAELLLREKLSCLGCHRFGERGGRIAPDLARVRERLQPDYVFRMIKDPRAVEPQTIMPKVPLSEETLELIANFLLQQNGSGVEIKYLSLIDNAIGWSESEIPKSVSPTARDHYLTYCAACHGKDGSGNGFNAPFLTPKPTIHADAKYMSSRPDDTLYDAISSGGYLVNRSAFMPAWRESFSPAEIKALVGYLRTLCRCDGPTWSRD